MYVCIYTIHVYMYMLCHLSDFISYMVASKMYYALYGMLVQICCTLCFNI